MIPNNHDFPRKMDWEKKSITTKNIRIKSVGFFMEIPTKTENLIK